MRECDGRCESGTALSCQMACKSRCTLWMLTLLASVHLIECHKRLSSVHSVTVTAAAVCFIGTVLNVLERELGTCSLCVWANCSLSGAFVKLWKSLRASSCLFVCQSANMENWAHIGTIFIKFRFGSN